MSTEAAAVQALLRRIGPVWASDINSHRDQVLQAYTPLLEAQPLPGMLLSAELSYGPHARQCLQVYQGPRGSQAQRSEALQPIAMFVHGGAFLRGQMNSNAQVYGNVPRYFARHGFVGVNMEYRLAPEAPFPAGAQDVGLAVDWLHQHAAKFGGDARRILLVGHSAGGAHVASYACDSRLRPAQPKVAGIALISARLRADVRADNPNAAGVRAYFGEEAWRYEADSPVSHAAQLNVPALLAVAEYENPWLDVYAAEFCHRVGLAQGRIPRLLCLPQHNHTSIVAHLDSGEASPLGEALRDFAAGLPPCPA